MVDAILAEMRRSLETRSWMSEETRSRALTKLDAVRVKIGYPDEWRDWSGLEVARDSFAANRIRASRFEFEHQAAKTREAGRSRRVGDVAPHGERLLPPDP